MSIYFQNLIRFTAFIGLIGTVNILCSNSVRAYSLTFDNGDFETSTDTLNNNTGWEGLGSADIRGIYSGISPYDTSQGVVTTGCPSTIQTGECTDSDNDGQPRNDDPPTAAGTYNLLGQDLLSASPQATGNLQNSLGLSDNALSIQREINGTLLFETNGDPMYKLPKEGSAIYQDITVTDDGSSVNDFVLSFDWDFATNDGSGDLGGKDFGFFSISGSGVEEVFVLEESTGNIAPLDPGDTNFETNTNTYDNYTSDPLTLAPGTYRVGFGVVDADGVSHSSGLMFDNFSAQEVPFEFSPATGIGLVATFLFFNRFRGRSKQKMQSKFIIVAIDFLMIDWLVVSSIDTERAYCQFIDQFLYGCGSQFLFMLKKVLTRP